MKFINVSPYGGKEIFIESIPVGYVTQNYKEKCGVDISSFFGNHNTIYLYKCELTGYLYWKPFDIAGNAFFYEKISSAWDSYYREERWEYPIVRSFLNKSHSVLEMGCGRGYFLKSIEKIIKYGKGLDFNSDAIRNKVTSFPVEIGNTDVFFKNEEMFDVVCGFQVLEHLVNPKEFLEKCFSSLKPGGLLLISTPSYDSVIFQRKLDCFDLPPHHMGHYSKDVFEKIGRIFDVELVKYFQQIRGDDSSILVTESTKRHIGFKIYKKLFSVATRIVFRLTKEPGHTILAVFRKNLNS